MQQIEQEVRQFVIDNFTFDDGNGHLCNDDSFLETGIIDSMGMLTLVDFVREKYGINIEDEELKPENLDSVSRITKFVQARLSSPTAVSVPTIGA
jgi:acyl carrier protein